MAFDAVIVLRDPLADLTGCRPHDGIGVCIVVRLPSENLHSESAFFQCLRISVERVFDDIAQENRKAPTVLEQRIGEHPL